MKYLNTKVVFQEIPNEISLAINLTSCPYTCKGCHSPELREDIGTNLNLDNLNTLIKNNTGISCVLFMGGDANIFLIERCCAYIKQEYNLKTAWYSGRDTLEHFKILDYLDYIKLGSYKEELGGLKNNKTNQRLYKIETIKL